MCGGVYERVCVFACVPMHLSVCVCMYVCAVCETRCVCVCVFVFVSVWLPVCFLYACVQ